MSDEVIKDEEDFISEEPEKNDETDEDQIQNINNPFPEIKPEEIEASLSSIKVELTEEDKAKYNVEVPAPPSLEKKKPGRQAKAKKDIPTPKEVNYEMTDEEIESGMDQKTKDLYMEFNSFLEDKTDIKSDKGIKDTLPTGIDLLDTIMGGGFAVGTMGVITGNPGSGKCLYYDEALEIYYE